MKVRTLFIIVILISLIGCDQVKRESIVVINTATTDTLIFKDVLAPKKVIVISERHQNLINSFRQPLQDIAYYMLKNPKSKSIDRFTFNAGKFEFWIGNGWGHFKLYSPTKMNLTDSEKAYFWKIYNNYLNNEMRVYNWEEDTEIIIKE